MSKFAKKEKFDAKAVVAGDSKLKKMSETSAVEKKEVAARIAAKKAGISSKNESVPSAKTSAKEKNSRLNDKKIKVLKKSHEASKGSRRAAWLDALLSSSTIKEARGKVEGLDSSAYRNT